MFLKIFYILYACDHNQSTYHFSRCSTAEYCSQTALHNYNHNNNPLTRIEINHINTGPHAEVI